MLLFSSQSVVRGDSIMQKSSGSKCCQNYQTLRRQPLFSSRSHTIALYWRVEQTRMLPATYQVDQWKAYSTINRMQYVVSASDIISLASLRVASVRSDSGCKHSAVFTFGRLQFLGLNIQLLRVQSSLLASPPFHQYTLGIDSDPHAPSSSRSEQCRLHVTFLWATNLS